MKMVGVGCGNIPELPQQEADIRGSIRIRGRKLVGNGVGAVHRCGVNGCGN